MIHDFRRLPTFHRLPAPEMRHALSTFDFRLSTFDFRLSTFDFPATTCPVEATASEAHPEPRRGCGRDTCPETAPEAVCAPLWHVRYSPLCALESFLRGFSRLIVPDASRASSKGLQRLTTRRHTVGRMTAHEAGRISGGVALPGVRSRSLAASQPRSATKARGASRGPYGAK